MSENIHVQKCFSLKLLTSQIALNEKKFFFSIIMINTVLCVVVAVTLTAIVNKNNAFIFGIIILP